MIEKFWKKYFGEYQKYGGYNFVFSCKYISNRESKNIKSHLLTCINYTFYEKNRNSFRKRKKLSYGIC